MPNTNEQSNNTLQPLSIQLGDVVIDQTYLYNLTLGLNELNKAFNQPNGKPFRIEDIVTLTETVERTQGYIDLLRACKKIVHPMYDHRFIEAISNTLSTVTSTLAHEVNTARRRVSVLANNMISDYKSFVDICSVIDSEVYATYRECTKVYNADKWLTLGQRIQLTLAKLDTYIEKCHGIEDLRKTPFVEYNEYSDFMLAYDHIVELRKQFNLLNDTYQCMCSLFI